MTDGITNTCPSCGRTKKQRHYLCGRCWYSLAPETRRRLWLKDGAAAERLMELYRQCNKGVPLADIRVAA